jgi:hypothetical protein
MGHLPRALSLTAGHLESTLSMASEDDVRASEIKARGACKCQDGRKTLPPTCVGSGALGWPSFGTEHFHISIGVTIFVTM